MKFLINGQERVRGFEMKHEGCVCGGGGGGGTFFPLPFSFFFNLNFLVCMFKAASPAFRPLLKHVPFFDSLHLDGRRFSPSLPPCVIPTMPLDFWMSIF